MTENINKLEEKENIELNKPKFDEEHVLHKLKHYLPTQTPLKDFVHHNSLHAFQDMKFYDGIFKASEIFGYKVTLSLYEYRNLLKINRIKPEILERVIKQRKGISNYKEWMSKALDKNYDTCIKARIGQLRKKQKELYKIDLDNLVQPLLFRIVGSYIDQGISLWNFPFENLGLLNAIRELEKNSFTSFFKTKKARELLFDNSITIEKLLKMLVGDENLYEQYLFDQQFSHRGWSGMCATLEDKPESLLYSKKITLKDFIILELLLEIDALNKEFGNNWKPLALASKDKIQPIDLFKNTKLTELHEVLKIWQDAFEWSYYDPILYSVQHLNEIKRNNPKLYKDKSKHTFQSIFCIDERECSLRRHIEHIDPDCETLAAPGFFGVEFFFHPAKGKFYEKLCPAPVTPKYLIKEKETGLEREHEILFSKHSHTLFKGFLTSLSLGGWAALKLVSHIFNPKMSPAISNAFAHMNIDAELIIENTDPNNIENGLQVGFTVLEMADRVEGLLRGIGSVNNFSDLVYVVAHGSSSANNPHHGAHDCGACSGRPGATNSRVFAFMANHPKVREILASRGLFIPKQTVFIGAMHDTASDEIAFYDDKKLSGIHAKEHLKNKEKFESALDLNAKERSRRFASINTKAPIKRVREAIKKRSVSYFEPRPELGHGTNALCFVGHRSLTKGLFLDRRAFMNSYDYRTDPDGKLLLGVMKPLPPVCGGINLEYYFSRVDNYKLGAGTKLPHNVIGLIGVSNSSDGDLRPGLPLQMIEVHDPVRLLIVVEHYPDVVHKTVKSVPELYEWFNDDWVHLMVINPDDNKLYIFRYGEFIPYQVLTSNVEKIDNVHDLIESAKEMETNHILDATKENIPVHIINKR